MSAVTHPLAFAPVTLIHLARPLPNGLTNDTVYDGAVEFGEFRTQIWEIPPFAGGDVSDLGCYLGVALRAGDFVKVFTMHYASSGYSRSEAFEIVERSIEDHCFSESF